MTQSDRTPLSLLAGLLSADSAASQPAAKQPQAAEWWAQKKRKRTVSCGRCSACCREDCGKCLNCTDKPKFGGQGIRKQSCLERKCLNASAPLVAPSCSKQPNTAKAVPLPLRQLPKLADQAELRAKAGAMPPQEWRDFWSAVECCMRLQDADAKMVPAPADDRISSGKRARLARCGTCVGCTRGDCGECKNCKDKPKYGGPGIKKQACLQRACNNPLIDHSTDIDGVKEGFLSLEPSPALRPTEVSPEEVAPLDLGAEEVLDDEADVPDPTTSGMMLATRRRLDELRASQYGEPDVNSTELDAATAYSTADEAGDTDDVETHVQSHEAGPDGFPITASLLMVAAARAGDAALLQGDRTSSSSIPG